jgi:flagellar basal-body rod protein FlgF
MGNGIYSAVSGAVAQTRTLDVISNNLANVSTAGFKADRISFSEVLARAAKPGLPGSRQSFTRTAEVRMDLRPGALRETSNTRDVALEGPGFLCLRDAANKESYFRGGALQVRADGVLADFDGTPLLNKDNKLLRLNPDTNKLTISRNGTVQADGETAGQLKLVEFARPELLQRLGQTRYQAPAQAAPGPARETSLQQGYLERSNINLVRGVNSMVVASRTYEALHKVLSTFKEIDSKTATQLGQDR